jgi:hypothetical protein
MGNQYQVTSNKRLTGVKGLAVAACGDRED